MVVLNYFLTGFGFLCGAALSLFLVLCVCTAFSEDKQTPMVLRVIGLVTLVVLVSLGIGWCAAHP
jgi:hypothetical protein